jgi:mono/diheme cytochrome c family protein
LTALSNIPATSYAHLGAGRDLYVGKCTKCHSAEPIRQHSLSDWKEDIMPSMTKKAKLSPEEESNVLAYVNAVLKSPVEVARPGG